MKNIIKITAPVVNKNRVKYNYEVSGEWKEAFILDNDFCIEYDIDISNIPLSIIIIPLLCNILPISWIYDAVIYVESCDKAFYESIEEFKKGYVDMYPKIKFGGSIVAEAVVENSYSGENGSAAFFSGGVDAFNTLVNHAGENPTLLTIWGADVKHDDISGWQNVMKHINSTAQEFNVEYITIKSDFRKFLNENTLTLKVNELSGDNWWHGFQHGIGIIGHAAPVCFALNKLIVYFASSFTEADKGKITCASDPTIDNFVRFGNTSIIHDGYEYDRQDKIHNIVEYCRKEERKISLRVCWKSTGGKNCCECEKCWRTILGIIAEGEEASNYDMSYTDKQLKNFHKIYYIKKNIPDYRRDGVYTKIQDTMRKNLNYEQLPKDLQWFYKLNIKKLGYHPYRCFYAKVKNIIKRVILKILRK